MKVRVKQASAVMCNSKLTIAITAALAVLAATAVYAPGQDKDKHSLKSPSGIAFSDFRGYEDWATVSSARTDEVLKVIVANPAMINAFKTGVPGNGQLFPDGSMIVKLQWKPKKSTEAPFVVDVPDVFKHDAASDTFSADAKSLSDCGYACHTPVKAKDYIFHRYQKR
jgi:hypothetical protein